MATSERLAAANARSPYGQEKSIAILSSQAFSIVNFRGLLIRDLINANVKVYALAPDFDEKLREKVSALGAVPIDIRLDRTGMNPLRDGLDTLRLAALLRRLQPDLFLGYFIKPVIYGMLAAWLAGVGQRIAMIEGLGYVFTPGELHHASKRKRLRDIVASLFRLALACAHRVIFLNREDLAEFVRDGLVAESKVFNLGGIGVDLNEWSPTSPVTAPVTFLLAARLLREKGIVEFAEAARLVKARCPDVRFVLLGGVDSNPGGLKKCEVMTWVEEGLLEWPGHVEVKPWLAQASVYVLPSYYREGVPRSTQEAMAMARAVITTDAPGCRDTVIDGVNGFLVPVRNVAALADRMLEFVENPSLIENMGKESRLLAEERFDASRVNALMLEIFGV